MKLISESELIKPKMLFQVFKLPSVTWPITCQRLCEQDDVIFLHLSLKSLSDSKNVSFHTMCPRQQQEVQQLSDPSCIKTASTSSCTVLFFTSFIAYINHSFSLQPLKLSSAQLHETMKQEQSLQSKSPAELQRFR